jgi:choline-sulfatase
MARGPRYKYIFIANGGREQLPDLQEDPHELRNRIRDQPALARDLRAAAAMACRTPGAVDALDGAALRAFPFEAPPRRRIVQFDRSRGVTGFPERPGDVLQGRSGTQKLACGVHALR